MKIYASFKIPKIHKKLSDNICNKEKAAKFDELQILFGIEIKEEKIR